MPTDLKGLIPAHAGKTGQAGDQANETKAHPRSRGENQDLEVVLVHGEGSSPLTRGKRQVSHHGVHGCRLIPAHAGKTRTNAGKP